MLVIPNFERQSAALLREPYSNTSVAGQGEQFTHSGLAIRKIAAYLDIPEKLVKQVAAEIKFPRVQETVLKISNRVMIETEFGKAGVLGPKWAAIQYGITAQSLINVLTYVAERSSLSLYMQAQQILDAHRKLGVIDNLKTKYVMDRFLQSDESIIFSGSTDRAMYLKEICEAKDIEIELVIDAHVYWANAVRRSLRKRAVEINQDTATTFCVFTGLPVAHFRVEYSSQVKPGILQPDSISWLALIEHESLQQFCSIVDRQRFDEFIKFTFI